MQPLSKDLRERIVQAVNHNEDPRRALARRFQVNVSFIRQTGSLEPGPHGGGKQSTLDRDGLEKLRGLVEEQPDATLEELRQRMDVGGSITIVWRGLQKLGITCEKKTRHADEQDRPDVRQERRSFRRRVKSIEPTRLVVADETGVTTAMTPIYARAPRGERAVDSAPASWESVTVISAVSPDGARAPLAFPGATNVEAFQS